MYRNPALVYAAIHSDVRIRLKSFHRKKHAFFGRIKKHAFLKVVEKACFF